MLYELDIITTRKSHSNLNPSHEHKKMAATDPYATSEGRTLIAKNNLITLANEGNICTSFGVKIARGSEIAHIAKAAGYDSLFIDLEHTCMTISDASQLCITAISSGITPFVRVPHEAGQGYIQKVLDVGAMGVIIPHIHGVGEFPTPL